jgi:glycosyltransferase involved in cell wall biosynthesis
MLGEPPPSGWSLPFVRMKILLVSQMYPGPQAPDLGVFVKQVVDELEREGHVVERAVIDRRGGSRTKYARLVVDAIAAARRFRPDVVYAHSLFPAGAAAAAAARAAGVPFVLTAHGQDVRNIGSIPGVALATKAVVGRAAAVIAVSNFLRNELEAKLPAIRDRVHVIDCGVDLDRFRHRPAAETRAQVGWDGDEPFYLAVGTLHELKNPVRLADAFEGLGRGSLAFVGDGPLRDQLAGRPGVRVVGRVPHDDVARWMAACDVFCQPSSGESFGQTVLEAFATERPVVASQIGGPAELVTPTTGVLVDPSSVELIQAGLRSALELPRPNPEARAEAEKHDVRVQARRIAAVLAGKSE